MAIDDPLDIAGALIASDQKTMVTSDRAGTKTSSTWRSASHQLRQPSKYSKSAEAVVDLVACCYCASINGIEVPFGSVSGGPSSPWLIGLDAQSHSLLPAVVMAASAASPFLLARCASSLVVT